MASFHANMAMIYGVMMKDLAGAAMVEEYRAAHGDEVAARVQREVVFPVSLRLSDRRAAHEAQLSEQA